MVDDIVFGRGGFSYRGKRNGSRFYGFKWFTPKDGTNPELGLDYLAVRYGVTAIQNRLNAMGFPILVNGEFGPFTARAVRQLQKHYGLKVDGWVGPATAKVMWRDLVAYIGMAHCGRPELIWGQTMLESANGDPGAVSGIYKVSNGPDYGLSQINLRFNPHVTMQQAFHPPFALEWSAKRLKVALDMFDGKGPDLQTKCAVAYHNNPLAARQWYEIGWVGEDEQIALYVKAVLARAATWQ